MVSGGRQVPKVTATTEAQLKWKILLNCELGTSFAYGTTGGFRRAKERASNFVWDR